MTQNLTAALHLLDSLQSFGFQQLTRDETQSDVIRIGKETNAFMAILSLVGCLFSLTTCLVLKTWKTSIGKMVAGLCLMDLITNCAMIFELEDIKNPGLCSVQTFVICFGYAGSLSWTCCFAHSLYYSLRHGEQEVKDSLVKIYAWISTTAAVTVAMLSIITHYREIDPNNMNICLHVHRPDMTDLGDIIVLILPASISILICTFCYVAVIRKLKSMGTRMYIELLIYPLILLICLCPMTVMRIYTKFESTYKPSAGWYATSHVLFAAQGFFNAFAYGMSRKIILGYKNLCCKRNTKSSDIRSTGFVDDESSPNTDSFDRADMYHESLLSNPRY